MEKSNKRWKFAARLFISMKNIIIIGDGMADRPVQSLGGRTPLQCARTPYMDFLAREGRTGMLCTVPEGLEAGSEVANLSILGYDVKKVYQGRAVLEAAGMGIELQEGDLALRCNLVTVEKGLLKSHSSGDISTSEAAELLACLQNCLGDARITFYPGLGYRHLLVLKGGDKRLDCTPPHEALLQSVDKRDIRFYAAQAEETARLLNKLVLQSQRLLEEHAVNRRRRAQGKEPANSIWLWSPGYRPAMQPLHTLFPAMEKGTVISAVPLLKGIGRCAGLRCVEVAGATGSYDTNYENKVSAALEALKTDDFVYLHIEASDEASHEGNLSLKIRTLEDLDTRVAGPLYEAVKRWEEPVRIALLPDHPTPCEWRFHTADPVPFLVWQPGIQADRVQVFDEFSCQEGAYGWLKGDEFIQLLLEN